MSVYLAISRISIDTRSPQILWNKHDARFEVLRAVKMLIVVFWIVTPCSLVHGTFSADFTNRNPLNGFDGRMDTNGIIVKIMIPVAGNNKVLYD
jgi:hypothetical protein